ncbi:hypothetical protein AIF0345_2340 [Actinomyces israelii]|nr:hypothetical protein AIF0345_2340 [Actinomyces israelii]
MSRSMNRNERTRTAVSDRARPAPWWRILPVWARQELVLLLREPVAVFFSLAFPVIMYVFIGIPHGSTEIGPGVHFIDAMFSALVLTVVANLLLMGLPIYLAELRSHGVDRRYAVVPLPSRLFAAAVLASTLVLAAGASTIIILVVGLHDGLRASLWSPVYLLLLLGSVLWLSALGFLIGTLRVSTRTTQALSAAVFLHHVLRLGRGRSPGRPARGPLEDPGVEPAQAVARRHDRRLHGHRGEPRRVAAAAPGPARDRDLHPGRPAAVEAEELMSVPSQPSRAGAGRLSCAPGGPREAEPSGREPRPSRSGTSADVRCLGLHCGA